MKRVGLSLALAGFLAAAIIASPQGQVAGRARNVILFLADAGGIPTLHAASVHAYGEARRLFVQRMPHIGLSDTSTASQYVTDSAAGMTAIVTGVRTHNGVIGQGPDAVRGSRDGVPLRTILELAEAQGLSTGLISNDALTGATPAALYAKVHDRGMTAEIFRQALVPRSGDGIEVLIGSGRTAISNALLAKGSSIDLVARDAQRTVVDSMESVGPDAARAVVLLDTQEFDLAAAIRLARRILERNPRGYFLMVESDTHTDVVRHGIERMVAFDRVIEQVATSASQDTLLLFTADHSFDLRVHGGLRGQPLLTGDAKETARGLETVELAHMRMHDTHTGEEVLVAAQGPGSERVHGYMANTDLFEVMRSAYGWTR